MGRMTPRSDASAVASSSFPLDGDRDVLAINGHHFDLAGPGVPGLAEPA